MFQDGDHPVAPVKNFQAGLWLNENGSNLAHLDTTLQDTIHEMDEQGTPWDTSQDMHYAATHENVPKVPQMTNLVKSILNFHGDESQDTE